MEQHLAKMERREKALVAKSELQEGRLQQKPSLSSSASASSRGQRRGGGGGNVQNAEKLRMLKGKKERLAHTIERLSLQAGHKVCYSFQLARGLFHRAKVDTVRNK